MYENIVPETAVLLEERTYHQIYYHDGTILIHSTDYHPKPLELKKEDLEKLLEKIISQSI